MQTTQKHYPTADLVEVDSKKTGKYERIPVVGLHVLSRQLAVDTDKGEQTGARTMPWGGGEGRFSKKNPGKVG